MNKKMFQNVSVKCTNHICHSKYNAILFKAIVGFWKLVFSAADRSSHEIPSVALTSRQNLPASTFIAA